MNKNKQKYISVPQDSFKFESFNRLDSVPTLEPNNTINYQARINEICLKAASNKTDWDKFKSVYYKIEITLFTFGLILSILSLAASIYVLFYTKFTILLKFIPDWTIFQYPALYLAFEFSSLLLDLIKLILIIIIRNIFKSNIETNLKNETSALYETIYHLYLRSLIREKLKAIKSYVCRAEILINSYFLVLIIAIKYTLAIYLTLKLGSLLDIKETVNLTIYCNETIFIDSYNCLSLVQVDLKSFMTIFILFLYITSSLRLLAQTLILINFKYCLCFCIIKSLFDEELELIDEYQKCMDKIYINSINNQIEESQEYYANKFFDLNTFSKSGYNSKSNYVNEPKYLNEDVTSGYINEDEINAIRLIEDVTKDEK